MTRLRRETLGTLALAMTGLVLTAGAGCRSKTQPSADGSASALTVSSSAPRPALAVGDELIVKDTIGEFRLARIVQVNDASVLCEFAADRSKAEIPKDLVARVSASGYEPGVNEFVICQTTVSHWEGCHVQQRTGETFVVRDESGVTRTLEAAKIVQPSPTMAQRIKQRFEQNTTRDRPRTAERSVAANTNQAVSAPAHNTAAAATAAATVPVAEPAPPYEPRPGDEVLAKREDGSWYAGRIRRLTPTKVHVVWDDKQPWSQCEYGDVVQKPSNPAQVEPGQRVLAASKPSGKWEYFQVREVDKRHAIVEDSNGEQRKVRRRDMLVVDTRTP